MATTNFYGWSEPDNTSLVKNGAQDIRILGDAIDASVWNIGYGQAGKNKFINGDFAINQRAFTSTTSSNTYGFDRWKSLQAGGTSTYSAQTFTVGSAPVAGYEARNYARIVTSGQSAVSDYSTFDQAIESVRTFAGQTVTVSFWAKAGTGTPKIAVSASQNFGTGGSPSSVVITYGGQATLSTSWARYSITMAIPSISGKTLGTTAGTDSLEMLFWVSAGSNYNAFTGSLGIQNNTFDFWGAQIEYGSKATPFQTASGGSPQAELAMCQRYYQASGLQSYYTTGSVNNTTDTVFAYQLIQTMRVSPTITISATGDFNLQPSAIAISSFNSATSTASKWSFYTTSASVLTAGQSKTLFGATANSNIQFSAEL
jgi:hypothetical protein